jgi:hypothetical protein
VSSADLRYPPANCVAAWRHASDAGNVTTSFSVPADPRQGYAGDRRGEDIRCGSDLTALRPRTGGAALPEQCAWTRRGRITNWRLFPNNARLHAKAAELASPFHYGGCPTVGLGSSW